MADIQSILELDRELLFFFNGSDSLFVDGLMATFTSGFTWIPLYVGWLYLVIKNNEKIDNRFVVPYNRDLLLKYIGHMNVEYYCHSALIKYLFK